MNRRRLLQAFAAATFAAVVEVTGLQPALITPTKVIVNPDYIRAPYEVLIIDLGGKMVLFDSHPDHIMRSQPRYIFEGGKYVELPKYIEA